MNATVICYIIYLAVSLALTIWVAGTLHRNGRVFLIEAFHGNAEMADSVNHLLVVGFYLINVGYIALALKYGEKPGNMQEGFEFLSTKLGLVLLVLGGMHFFNMFNFDKMRRKGRRAAMEPPPPPPLRTTPLVRSPLEGI
jgi:hypothetical protein